VVTPPAQVEAAVGGHRDDAVGRGDEVVDHIVLLSVSVPALAVVVPPTSVPPTVSVPVLVRDVAAEPAAAAGLVPIVSAAVTLIVAPALPSVPLSMVTPRSGRGLPSAVTAMMP